MSNNAIKQFLEDQRLSFVEVSNVSGLKASTLSSAAAKPVLQASVRVIAGIAKTVDMSPGQLVDKLLQIEDDNYKLKHSNLFITDDVKAIIKDKGLIIRKPFELMISGFTVGGETPFYIIKNGYTDQVRTFDEVVDNKIIKELYYHGYLKLTDEDDAKSDESMGFLSRKLKMTDNQVSELIKKIKAGN